MQTTVEELIRDLSKFDGKTPVFLIDKGLYGSDAVCEVGGVWSGITPKTEEEKNDDCDNCMNIDTEIVCDPDTCDKITTLECVFINIDIERG